MNFITIFADIVKPIKLRGTGTFNPVNTGVIDENLSCIRQKDVNMWFYKKENTIISIDSGYKNDINLFKDLEKINIDNEKIEAVFLTHGDVDHVGGIISNNRFAPNAMVYLHNLEENMLLGREYRFGKGPIKIKNPVNFVGEYELFNDRKIFNIGNIKIECFHCSGHTKGHTVYLIDDKYLFTGDSIATNHLGGFCFFNFYNMNTKENISSLEKLKLKISKNPPEFICTSHNGICSYDKAFFNVQSVAKASKRNPFDATAPNDVFNMEE